VREQLELMCREDVMCSGSYARCSHSFDTSGDRVARALCSFATLWVMGVTGNTVFSRMVV
jgi:hypothetical protein